MFLITTQEDHIRLQRKTLQEMHIGEDTRYVDTVNIQNVINVAGSEGRHGHQIQRHLTLHRYAKSAIEKCEKTDDVECYAIRQCTFQLMKT